MKTRTDILLLDALLGGGIAQGSHYCLIGNNYNDSMNLLKYYFENIKSSNVVMFDRSGVVDSKHAKVNDNPNYRIDDFLLGLDYILSSGDCDVLIVTLSGFSHDDINELSEIYVKYNSRTTLVTLGGFTKTEHGLTVHNTTSVFETTVKSLLCVKRRVWVNSHEDRVYFHVRSHSGDSFRVSHVNDEWGNTDSFEVGMVVNEEHPILKRGDFDEGETVMKFCRKYGLYQGNGGNQFFSFEPDIIFKNRLESARYLYSNPEKVKFVKSKLLEHILTETR